MSNDNPLVSVIIPTYNRAHMVSRAIQSVMDQTYGDFELIVVDDASNDDTEEIFRKFNDERVNYLRHDRNKGVSVARNTGIRSSKGKYIAFLDSDDEWLPEKLEKQIEYFSKTDKLFGVIYSRSYKTDHLGVIWRDGNPKLYSGDVWLQLLRGWCPPITSSVLVKRVCFDICGGFNESLPSFEDYDLWLRIAQSFHFELIDEPLVIINNHSGPQVSKDVLSRLRGLTIFLEQWSPTISKYTGERGREFVRNKFLGDLYFSSIMTDLRASRRLSALRNFPKILASRQMLLQRTIRILIGFIGGPNILNNVEYALKKAIWGLSNDR